MYSFPANICPWNGHCYQCVALCEFVWLHCVVFFRGDLLKRSRQKQSEKIEEFPNKGKLMFQGTQTFDRSFLNIVINLWTTNALVSYICSISVVCSKLMAITFKPILIFLGTLKNFGHPQKIVLYSRHSSFHMWKKKGGRVACFFGEGVVVACTSTKCLSWVTLLFWCVSAQV